MRTYDHILQGSEATLENAIEHAKHLDWQDIEQTEQNNLPYLCFKDEHNGIEIWECYGTGSYIFSDSENIDCLLKLHKNIK